MGRRPPRICESEKYGFAPKFGTLVQPHYWSRNGEVPRLASTPKCSGVVVVDKSRNLAGALMTCYLNTRKVRDQIIYHRFYGDKESYWFAHALTSAPYHFVPGYSGALGRITKPQGDDVPDRARREEICTLQILHVLESTGQPFWFNNAMIENKAANDLQYIVPEGWIGHNG